MKGSFVVKGDICFAPESGRLECQKDGYLVVEEGLVSGIFTRLPDRYKGLEFYDHTGRLVIPGMTDLHAHAPQYGYRGTGMDLELLDWLNNVTFPVEAHFEDMEYARESYDIFVSDLKDSATTRAVLFASIHLPATEFLMSALDKAGLGAYVGKVNMDRNSPDYYCEQTEASLRSTVEWLDDVSGRYEKVKPILTPRFVPACSDKLMKELGKLAADRNIPVQSHLSENFSEIEWVKELAPEAAGYADAYDRFGLFGSSSPAIMAHCIHMREDELELMKQRDIYVAHSPESNINLRSGIAPVRKMLNRGIRVGLATDLAAGSNVNMFRAISEAIQVSKLRWRLVDQSEPALKFAEAFYMATKAGGSFFGKVGSFEEGYEADILVLDDSMARTAMSFDMPERLERTIYLGESSCIIAKFVGGNKVK